MAVFMRAVIWSVELLYTSNWIYLANGIIRLCYVHPDWRKRAPSVCDGCDVVYHCTDDNPVSIAWNWILLDAVGCVGAHCAWIHACDSSSYICGIVDLIDDILRAVAYNGSAFVLKHCQLNYENICWRKSEYFTSTNKIYPKKKLPPINQYRDGLAHRFMQLAHVFESIGPYFASRNGMFSWHIDKSYLFRNGWIIHTRLSVAYVRCVCACVFDNVRRVWRAVV